MNQQKTWWNQESETDVISGPTLLNNLEQSIFAQSPPTPSQLQSVTDLSRELWSHFNTKRTLLDKDYMSDEKMLNAYLASFFLPNIERVRCIATKPRVIETLSEIAKSEVISVLDFGSGPLSASIGFVLALNQIRSKQASINSARLRVHITAVERSEKAVRRGEFILKSSLSSHIQIEVSRSTSIPKNAKHQIILAANIFNEIPERHQQKTLDNLILTLDPSSANLALILEPGQESLSRSLAAMRDKLLADQTVEGLRVIAPCPHQSPCPLSASMARNDWCWFKVNFKRPPLLMEIDRRTRIEHNELAFSFLAMTSSMEGRSERPWAVCVSDEMPVGKDSDNAKRLGYFRNNLIETQSVPSAHLLESLANDGIKTKLCGPSGAYLAGLRLKNPENPPLERGMELESSAAFAAVISER